MRAMSPLARMTGRPRGEPVDRLGRIAAAMLKTAEEHPEARPGDKAIIMLDDADGLGMTAPGGYDKTEGADAFVSMLAHLSMLAEVNGMQLDVIPMAEPPGQG